MKLNEIYTGLEVGSLTVLSESYLYNSGKKRYSYVDVRCACGKEYRVPVCDLRRKKYTCRHLYFDNGYLRSNGHRDSRGYIKYQCLGHPNADKRGSIFEHTKVMSDHIGRPLLPNENVHHKNGIRDDNRIENLELWSVGQPAGQRVEDLVAWSKEILRMYEPESLC